MIKRKNNGIIFGIFALLIALLVLLFGAILYNQIIKKSTVYSVTKGCFGYDINNDYFTIDSAGKVSKKWDDLYYLNYTLDGEMYEKKLGVDNVLYNDSDNLLYVFGNNYEVLNNGDVLYNKDYLELSLNKELFYKLDDRKYLIVSNTITIETGEDEKNDIKTKKYLVVEIDKIGNYLLLNNELNLKILGSKIVKFGDYIFDVAHETLSINGQVIDLKKINGSTNEYKDEVIEQKEETDDKNANANTNTIINNNTNSNVTNNNSNTNIINGGGVNLPGNNTNNNELMIVNSIQLTSVVTYPSYVDIYYSVVDPKNEFASVFLLIEGDNYQDKIILSKNLTMYRIRNLNPGSLYKISLCYSYYDGARELNDEVVNVISATTKNINSRIKVNKINNNSINFTVYFDNTYAFEHSYVSLTMDSQRIGRVQVNTNEAISSSGFNYTMTVPNGIGYEIVLELEDCVYEGEKILCNTRNKFINK